MFEQIVLEQNMEVDGEADRCQIKLLGRGPVVGQNFMANRMADRVAYLERRMLDFAAALEVAEGCSVANPVDVPTQVSYPTHVNTCGAAGTESEGLLQPSGRAHCGS